VCMPEREREREREREAIESLEMLSVKRELVGKR
jgi:hypothetical protein